MIHGAPGIGLLDSASMQTKRASGRCGDALGLVLRVARGAVALITGACVPLLVGWLPPEAVWALLPGCALLLWIGERLARVGPGASADPGEQAEWGVHEWRLATLVAGMWVWLFRVGQGQFRDGGVIDWGNATGSGGAIMVAFVASGFLVRFVNVPHTDSK